MKNERFRLIFYVTITPVLIGILYTTIEYFCSVNGNITNRGNTFIGLSVGMWLMFLSIRITTGKWLPIVNAANAGEKLDSNKIPIKLIGLSQTKQILLLTVIWVAAIFYTNLLHQALTVSLSNPSAIGLKLDENTWMRIATEIGGIMCFGIVFPLIAISSFLIGALGDSKLKLRSYSLPALITWLSIAIWNYGSEIMSSGKPPSYDVLRMILYSSKQSITIPDIVILWIIFLAFFLIAIFCVSSFGWLCGSFAYVIRINANKNNIQLNVAADPAKARVR